MNTPKEIGDYIKLLRKASDMSQIALAAKMGIAPSTLAQFESGRKNMTLSTLNKIADAMGYDLDVSFKPKLNPVKK
ncbi:helix-turn-helix domain-containing protein [Fibrella forsythiae]|uniref:Helix-turn-helix transcriptional regulator n=1 Tax=Fibrella forsythiae TaxID=2817061 RepID=A0ABS3JBB4_9BACT|nr:helix-turn-helix transcriptional regulator [Fibrella forsythiae]MBO0947277.1 helix-turn-helix transcriptional regulator [Fibrella forsythiae]